MDITMENEKVFEVSKEDILANLARCEAFHAQSVKKHSHILACFSEPNLTPMIDYCNKTDYT